MKLTWDHYPFIQISTYPSYRRYRPAAGPVEDAEEQNEAPAPAWPSDFSHKGSMVASYIDLYKSMRECEYEKKYYAYIYICLVHVYIYIIIYIYTVNH